MTTNIENPAQKTPKAKRWRKVLFYSGIVVLTLISIIHGPVVVGILNLRHTNPSTTAIIDERARLAVAKGIEPKREQTWVPIENVSKNLIRAIISGEDPLFFTHSGFDWESIEKAIEEDMVSGEYARGASSITQQLAKNLFLSRSKTIFRKLHEAIIAFEMEKTLGKHRILELYLNVVELGDGIYGVEAAAKRYFNSSAADLSNEQAAFLSAILPSPCGALDPNKFQERVQERVSMILERMQIVEIPEELERPT